MPQNYSRSQSATYTNVETLQRVSFPPEGDPVYSYVVTYSQATGVISTESRVYSGSAGVGYRDGLPEARPARACSDVQLKTRPGVLREVTYSAGYGMVWYISNDLYSIGGVLNTTTLLTDPKLMDFTYAKLLSDLRDLKVSLPVMAAEAHKTANHLRDTANRVYLAMRNLRYGNFRSMVAILKAKRSPREKLHMRMLREIQARKANTAPPGKRALTADDVSSLWLEYSYAWLPLLSDVYGLAKLVAEKYIAGDKTKWIRVSKQQSTTLGQIDHSGYYSQRRECKLVCRVGGYVRYKLHSSALASQAGMTNPLETVWERVPFSFVADWFVNIGFVLEALTTLRDLEFANFWSSSLHDQTSITSVRVSKSDAGWTKTYRNFADPPSHSHRQYVRSKFSPSIPKLAFKPDPFNLSHALSATALTVQQLRRL